MFQSLRNLHLPSAPRVWLPGKSTPYKKRVHVMSGFAVHRNAAGDILWVQDGWNSNILHDEGEQAILSAYFDTDLSGFGAPPSSLYVGLDARSSLAEDDTLTTASADEPDGTGAYARKAISTTSGFTLAQASTHYAATSAEVTWTASGGDYSKNVSNSFLATASTGTSGNLICSLALGSVRDINAGDSLDYTISVGLHE